MTLSKIKSILNDGGVLSADENGFTILRSDTKTKIKVLAREIDMFEYMYDDNKKV